MASNKFEQNVLDKAVETGAPLLVRRRCNAHQLAAWLAVRFLLDVTHRTAFGSREIAGEMNTASYPRVAVWLSELVELGLLEHVGDETVPGGKNDRPIYRIPWKFILDTSNVEAEQYIAKIASKRRRKTAAASPDQQLPLDLTVTDGSRETVTDRSRSDDPTVIDGSRSTRFHRDRSVTLGGTDGFMGGREGSRARAKKKTAAAAEPSPPGPDGAPPLPAHPFDLWRQACAGARPIDEQHLTALAAEHDTPTGGHGMYYVGRAILAASVAEDVRTIRKLQKILSRWRSEASYGSDLYTETTNGKPLENPRRHADRGVASGPKERGPSRKLDPSTW